MKKGKNKSETDYLQMIVNIQIQTARMFQEMNEKIDEYIQKMHQKQKTEKQIEDILEIASSLLHVRNSIQLLTNQILQKQTDEK